MKKSGLYFFTFMFAISIQAFASEVTTEIGKWRHHAGRISFAVKDSDGFKTAIMFVSDEHVIDTNLFSMKEEELQELRIMIDKTLENMQKG